MISSFVYLDRPGELCRCDLHAAYPRTSTVCIVHLVQGRLEYVTTKDSRPITAHSERSIVRQTIKKRTAWKSLLKHHGTKYPTILEQSHFKVDNIVTLFKFPLPRFRITILHDQHNRSIDGVIPKFTRNHSDSPTPRISPEAGVPRRPQTSKQWTYQFEGSKAP